MFLRTSHARYVVIALTASVAVAVLGAALLDRYEADRRRRERASAHLEQGMRLYHRKDYPRAEAALRLGLTENLHDWKAPFYVGAIQIERRRYELAVPYFERALNLNPTEPKILNALGVAYFKLGRLDMAQGYFWAAVDLDPANRDAAALMETMAKLQWKTGQMAGAKE